ncbi:MAG TPA: glycosyltransferase, partial [Chthoniobacterales bacterium]
PFWPQHAAILREGRADLQKLPSHFPISCGVSAYNARELADCGFRKPGILPLPIDPARWDVAADPKLMAELQDGRTNLLFVGRIAPNKKQHELVVAFREYLRVDESARLILIGKAEEADPYALHVQNKVSELGLEHAVLMPGSISEAQLAAYWRTATLFWSMSEHEGFCAPLIEAMWFDVPVLAFRSSAVPETLGEAGLMFTEKDDQVEVAAMVRLLVTDHALREKVIRAQRKRRVDFLPAQVAPRLENLVQQFVSAA